MKIVKIAPSASIVHQFLVSFFFLLNSSINLLLQTCQLKLGILEGDGILVAIYFKVTERHIVSLRF